MADLLRYTTSLTTQGRQRRELERQRQQARQELRERYLDARDRIRYSTGLLGFTGEQVVLFDARVSQIAPFITPLAQEQLLKLQGMAGVIGASITFDFKEGV